MQPVKIDHWFVMLTSLLWFISLQSSQFSPPPPLPLLLLSPFKTYVRTDEEKKNPRKQKAKMENNLNRYLWAIEQIWGTILLM